MGIPFCWGQGSLWGRRGIAAWRRGSAAGLEGGGEPAQRLAELVELGAGEPGGVGEPLRNAGGAGAEGGAGRGEETFHPPFVRRGPRSFDVAEGVEPLQQGRERAGVQAELLAQLPDTAGLVL